MTNFSPLKQLFEQSLCACRELYVGSARWCINRDPECAEGDPNTFVQLMDDLHAGLLTKIFVTVANADKHWSPAEEECATVLLSRRWE